MKVIKIGQINFYGNSGEYRFQNLCDQLNKFSIKHYKYVNCINEECDIVFYSLYDKKQNLQKVKGNPIFIFWTDEHQCVGSDQIFWEIYKITPFNWYKGNNLSISFYDDNNDNLFFPYFVIFIPEYLKIRKANPIIYNKTKFCTFCALNANTYEATFRTNIVKYISNNYKQITCCGKVLNNTNHEYLPYDYDKATKYHLPYKFNLCFENSSSDNNLTYITEKIIFALMYGVVPIYWGANRITEWFDNNSFINCNGLNQEEILERIKEVDNNDDLYKSMINTNPIKMGAQECYNYFIKKLDNFLINIV